MKKPNKIKNNIEIITLVALILGILSIVYLLISKNKEVVIEKGVSDYSFLALNCKSQNPSGEKILNTLNHKNEQHEIRGVFNDDGSLKNLFYTYEGEYSNEKDANDASASLHADYNTFMGEQNQKQSLFTPTFSHTDNKAKFSLYAESKDLDLKNAAIFLLRSDIKSLTIDSIKDVYENKNFTCIVRERDNKEV